MSDRGAEPSPQHSYDERGLTRLSVTDLAIDHSLAQMSASMRFLLDVTPTNADDVKRAFLAGDVGEPDFAYRPLDADPEVLQQVLANIDVGAVEDPTLGHLLRAKHREMGLQLEMLRARGSDEFRQLSIELYGGSAPALGEQAEKVLRDVPVPEARSDALDAEAFLALAEEELAYYRELDPEVDIHAAIRDDVNGVMVSGNTLLIDPDAHVQRVRAEALIHHEVGTHLVTHVNGSRQPVQVLGAGLAGYDETQEGLAVLAEIACGGFTPFRLRQLAARVVTVHRLTAGESFVASWQALVDAGFPLASAFTTTMRAYRSGGLTKDAIYLRGLVDLLAHLRDGGELDLLWIGKFSLVDLPLVRDLVDRGVLRRAAVLPRYIKDPDAAGRLSAAAQSADDVAQLVGGDAP
jgi:uncharacterized protein (TIGR02421 family)